MKLSSLPWFKGTPSPEKLGTVVPIYAHDGSVVAQVYNRRETPDNADAIIAAVNQEYAHE